MSMVLQKSRSPVLILLCGCFIAMVTFGPRSAMGLFTVPYTVDRGISLEMFSFAMAVQNLVWGLGAPFAGAIADRYGTVRVFSAGLLLYAAGLAMMAYASDPLTLNLGAGVLVGIGLSGSAFGLVLAAFGKLMPDRLKGLSYGLGSAAGYFVQCWFAPFSVLLIREIGWQPTLLVFVVLLVLTLPMTLMLSTGALAAPKAVAGPVEAARQVLARALAHRSYILLVIGFFVCGFHLAFVTIHLPKYLVERGLPIEIGAWTLAAIGLFNIAGSLGSGILMGRMPKRWLLACIYLGRALAIAVFVTVPITPLSAILFGAVMGLLWLSTIPPTNGLIGVMFGTKWMGILYGLTFFSHQVGSFVGLVIAGWTRSAFGSYDVIWWLGVLLGLAAAIVHMPIKEQAAPQPGTLAQPA
jgi:MFS family permease